MKYRIDRYVQNEHDPSQQVGFTDWIGGPTLANVRGAIISGTTDRRAARITGEPDTWFSVPAEIKHDGKRVTGWLGCDDGVYVFHPHHDQMPKDGHSNNLPSISRPTKTTLGA